MPGDIRVGIIGAGYISTWHADAVRATPGARLVAVCDTAANSAENFAANFGISPFTNLDDMLAAGIIDAVHITTPPHLHHGIALKCIAANLHVLVEKPVALNGAQTAEIAAAANAKGVRFFPGHNFLAIPAYRRLKQVLSEGRLGRVSTAEITWAYPLTPLRAGPYGIWLMRETQNLLLELGPHLFAFAQDLFGTVEVLHLATSKPISLPGGSMRPQSFRILARAGNVDLTLSLSLVETFDDRSLTLRGSTAMARLDYAADTLTIAAPNTSDLVLNPLRFELAQVWGHLREGARNATRQLVSLNQKSPYGLSFRGLCREFYDVLLEDRSVNQCFSGETVTKVMQAIDHAIALLPPEPKRPKPRGKPKPDTVVIGGTGFIGRALTRKLVERGHDVRVLSRGATGPFDDIADHVETISVSLSDEAALSQAMMGIKFVFNLARSLNDTWQAALDNDVATSLRIARAAQAVGVERLVYTGTIASYDMSDPKVTITEHTDFGPLESRNLYARSKAECERRLMEMHCNEGLPLVIARPAIVVGEGGPMQHWGIGRWHGAGAVKLWGNGQNKLPFVLIDDCADALVRMIETPGCVGESFNLAGDPMLTAREYFDGIHSELGARIKISSGPIWAYYVADALKFTLKTKLLRRKGHTRPSLIDWKSRAHFSSFDNSKAKRVLGWQPEQNRAAFINKAITRANLLGF